MKTFLRKSGFLTIVFLIANLFFASAAFGQATVITDKSDYKPGDPVIITGAAWLPGEQVVISIKEIPSDNAPMQYTVSSDADGKILMNQFVTQQIHLGKAFFVTAKGFDSQYTAECHFTDAPFTSVTNGAWNSPATWGLTGAAVEGTTYPGASDQVTIQERHDVTLTQNASCFSLNVSGAPNNNDANNPTSLNLNGFNLTAPSVNIICSNNGRPSSIITGAGKLTLTTLTLTGSGNSGSGASIAKLDLSGGGTLEVSGSIVKNNTNNVQILTTGSTIDYNGSGAQTILPSTSYYKLITSGSGIKSMSTDIIVTNTFDIGSGTIVDALTFNTTILGGTTLNVNGTLNFSNSNGLFQSGTTGVTTLNMGLTGKIQTVDAFGLGPLANASLLTQSGGTWTTSSINTNGTIEYYLTGAQDVTTRTYNNLVLNGSGIKTFGGSIIINGNLSISGTAIANLGSSNSTAGSLTLGGVAQPKMSWGSTASAAINKSSTYFGTTATGILNPCATITAALSGTSSICSGSSANLTIIISGGISPYTVVYAGGAGGTVTSYISGSNISVSPISNTTYTLISVTDANGCVAAASGSAVITVNTTPVLGAIGNKNVNEVVNLAFTATATDQDVPSQTLTFALDAVSIAAGMSITTGGAFSWTPSEAQGGTSYPVTVTVTDNGTCILTDFETFNITVNEVNVAPVLAAIGGQSVDEEALLTFTASASDYDLNPANTLTFS
jgi:hypothetical protein